jgi:hypothetical protein
LLFSLGPDAAPIAEPIDKPTVLYCEDAKSVRADAVGLHEFLDIGEEIISHEPSPNTL